MKHTSDHLLKFAAVAAVLTLLFRFTLTAGIEARSVTFTTIAAVAYAAAMYAAGHRFSNKEDMSSPVYDSGFRYHLTTYLVHNLVSLLWIKSGLASGMEDLDSLVPVAAPWGIGLLIHAIIHNRQSRERLAGLDRDEIFE
jgi:hypothetical protein